MFLWMMRGRCRVIATSPASRMFAVLVVEAVPEHLSGYLSRYMQEVSTGVFVGTMSGKVAEALWSRVQVASSTGRAVLVSSGGELEQGYRVRISGFNDREVRDFDGWECVVKRRSAGLF